MPFQTPDGFVMPTWAHTHNVNWRGKPHPVMVVDVHGVVRLCFRSDGMVEWLITPGGQFLHRGDQKQGASLEDMSVGLVPVLKGLGPAQPILGQGAQ
jgi:hypothetical protein